MATKARGWAATALITGLLLAASAAPVRAAGPAPIPWTPAPCVTVQSMQPGLQLNLHYNVVEGRVSQCRPVVAGGGFRVATYQADQATGIAPGYNVRLFSSARAGEVVHFGMDALPLEAGVFGLCVLARGNARVACFRAEVRVGEETFEDTLSPLSVRDPLVNKPVVTSPYIGARGPGLELETGPRPACGSCF